MNIILALSINLEFKAREVFFHQESVIKNHLNENPFELGKFYLEMSNNTFAVIKVIDTAFIYEYNKKLSNIKITDIESNVVTYSSNPLQFQIDNNCEVVFPKFKHLTYPIFGLEKVENELKYILNLDRNLFVVMHGPIGCGKKSLMEKLADEMENKYFIWLDYNVWYFDEKYLQKLCRNITRLTHRKFVLCVHFEPYVMTDTKLRDDLYHLFVKFLNNFEIDIKILMEFPDLEEIRSRDLERFIRTVHVKMIDKQSRYELMKFHVKRLVDRDLTLDDADWKGFADNRLKLYSGMNIVNLLQNVRIKYQEITLERLDSCRRDRGMVPIELMDFIADLEPLHWSNIGGYEHIKSIFDEAIVDRLKSGDKAVRGVLLHGPPGCSKTMFARALATETGLDLLSIKPSTVMRGYVGESENLFRQILNKAIACAPSILFIDEIDILFPSRDGMVDSPVTRRLMSELLTFLDGIGNRHDVIFFAATNFVDKLDPALRRTGRIDLHIKIDLPDQIARESILRIVFPDSDGHFIVDQAVRDNFPLIASRLEGKSGADIVEFVEDVKDTAEYALNLHSELSTNPIIIQMPHVEECLLAINDH